MLDCSCSSSDFDYWVEPREEFAPLSTKRKRTCFCANNVAKYGSITPPFREGLVKAKARFKPGIDQGEP
jgi:hypothetical protein